MSAHLLTSGLDIDSTLIVQEVFKKHQTHHQGSILSQLRLYFLIRGHYFETALLAVIPFYLLVGTLAAAVGACLDLAYVGDTLVRDKTFHL